MNQAEAYENFYEGRKAKDEIAHRGNLKESWLKTAEALKVQAPEWKLGQKGEIEIGEVNATKALEIEKSVASLTEKSVAYRSQDLKTEQLASHLGTRKSREILKDVELYL
jgi:hypothetical protein